MTAPLSLPATIAVVLPGTGSDEVFVTSVFHDPLNLAGVRLIAPTPVPGAALARHLLDAIDEAAETADGPILVGGVSFGAHLAATWALRNPERCAGVMAALPAWNGASDDAPAAAAAMASAELVRAVGLERALELATSGVAPWLATELARAWRGHGEGLADGLEAAARYPAPELTALSGLRIPVGVAACTDDPVHPLQVAEDWVDAAPRSALALLTFDRLGADRTTLGHAAVRALRDALNTAP